MTSLIWIVAIILGAGTLAYNYASVIVWSIAGFVGLFIVSMLSPFSVTSLVMLWIAYFAMVIALNKTPLRCNYFSKPLLQLYKKVMPHMSQTEREAIDAGTVKWAGELFNGTPNWHSMLQNPTAKLTAEEQAFLDGPVEELCKMIDDWDITHNRADLPPEMWQFLKENKFFAFIIPKQYGGLDFSATANSHIVTKIAGFSISVATTVAVPNSLGPAELLEKYGTEVQKNYYLPRLATGEEIPCFALTAPTAGSDATSIPDSGIICKGQFEGKEIIGIKLNFNKRYITLAPVATVIGLAFKLYDPNHLLGQKEELGITCALLTRNLSGITIGRRHAITGAKFQNGPIQGKDVFIPIDWIIGGSKMIGRGWTMLVECLSVGRGITLPAMVCGVAKVGLRAVSAYARIRHQFGLPIGKFEGVEEVLTRIVGNTYIMEAMREMTVATIDRGEKPAVLTAIAKYHTTERGRQVSNDVMDISAGKGVCMGPDNYIAMGHASGPISITVEGANILTRSMIIFGQGAIRCHRCIFEEMHAALDKDRERGITRFDSAIFAHFGYAFSHFTRSLILALTSSRIVLAPESKGKRYFQHLTRMSSAFAFLSEVTMATMGGRLKRKEKISAHLGDVLSLLYLGSAVLKRFHDDGQPDDDLPLMHWACQHILNEIQQAMHEVIRNFPNRWIAFLLRWVIFPVGEHFHAPTDKLGHQVAKLFIEPTVTSGSFDWGICLAKSAINPIGRIEEAFKQVIMVEPIEKKVRQARKDGLIKGKTYDDFAEAALAAGVISEIEYKQVLIANAARMSVVNVNDFDPLELARNSFMGEIEQQKRDKSSKKAKAESVKF